jgi:hypothetical protein
MPLYSNKTIHKGVIAALFIALIAASIILLYGVFHGESPHTITPHTEPANEHGILLNGLCWLTSIDKNPNGIICSIALTLKEQDHMLIQNMSMYLVTDTSKQAIAQANFTGGLYIDRPSIITIEAIGNDESAITIMSPPKTTKTSLVLLENPVNNISSMLSSRRVREFIVDLGKGKALTVNLREIPLTRPLVAVVQTSFSRVVLVKLYYGQDRVGYEYFGWLEPNETLIVPISLSKYSSPPTKLIVESDTPTTVNVTIIEYNLYTVIVLGGTTSFIEAEIPIVPENIVTKEGLSTFTD